MDHSSEILLRKLIKISQSAEGVKEEMIPLLGRLADLAESGLMSSEQKGSGSDASGGVLTAYIGMLGRLMNALESGSEQAAADIVRDEIVPLLSSVPGQESDPGQAEAWAAGLKLASSKQVICMFGYGDGACYEALSRRAAADSVIIVYEPEKDTPLDLQDQLIANVDYYLQESMLVCSHPDYDKIFTSEYADFIRTINKNRERIMVNKNTLARFKDTASLNVLTNLHILEEANLVSDLRTILRPDIPVIIVSAGPSLDKNIEELKRAKGHCLIFAVDTAMKYMMQHDIMPDLGITVEPIKPMANYQDDRCFDVPHVFDMESNPEIVGRHRSRKFIYNCRDYTKRLLQKCGIEVPDDIPSGGSVATAAFAICYQLDIRHIIMIGQDLAYEGTATHAGGVESAGINGDIGYVMVDGALGGQVRTRSDWLGYLRWFENALTVAADLGKDMQVIDATEGGALIHGTEVMSLREAVDTCCSPVDYDFAEQLEKLPPMLDEAGYAKVRELAEGSMAELGTIKNKAEEASSLCRRIIKRGAAAGTDAAALNSLRRDCEAALMYPLINNYAVSDIADEVSRLRQAEGTDPMSIYRQQKLAFDAIAGACDYFIKSSI